MASVPAKAFAPSARENKRVVTCFIMVRSQARVWLGSDRIGDEGDAGGRLHQPARREGRAARDAAVGLRCCRGRSPAFLPAKQERTGYGRVTLGETSMNGVPWGVFERFARQCEK